VLLPRVLLPRVLQAYRVRQPSPRASASVLPGLSARPVPSARAQVRLHVAHAFPSREQPVSHHGLGHHGLRRDGSGDREAGSQQG
jgi:hypothetical protein